jgi:hypothetical protein
MNERATGHRESEESQGESCPVCGSQTVGDALESGAGIHWCIRCSWCQVHGADGRLAKEAGSQPAA